MKKIAFLVLSVLMISSLNINTAFAIDGSQDANCANVDQYGFINVGLNGPDEQTFTPSYDRFTGATFLWGGQMTGVDGINISLINSIGTVVGTKTVSPSINGGPVTRDWTPDSPISVRKGVTYKLRVENPNGADLVWYSGMNDCYLGGNARQGNTDKNFDFGFSTYGFDAPVATATPAEATPAETATVASTPISNTSLNTGSSAGTGAAPSTNTSSSILEPTALQIEQITVDDKPVLHLTWSASKTTSIDGYKIFRAEGDSTTFKNTAKVTSKIVEFKDGEIEVGKTYKYQVRAYKGTSESKSSNIVSKSVEAVVVALVATITATETPIVLPVVNDDDSNWQYYFIAGILLLIAALVILYRFKKWPFNKKKKDAII